MSQLSYLTQSYIYTYNILQSVPEAEINPDIIGEIAGPAKGAKPKTDIATPLPTRKLSIKTNKLDDCTYFLDPISLQ